MIGQSIAHYEVTGKLGEGGMGVVYRARDTKLGREVALKVLPEAFAHDEQRMGRFEREARLLASLNHPHIAHIHGLEESNGVRALVMELVEGPTLADRIAEGPIPLDEALPIARQIAEALEYAHERGVIHRDLKPANIKLTREDQVKVLDFGLAKAMTDDLSSADPAASPTLTIGATQAGVILGTAAYMAPEQARGKAVDRRADIWAFAVVLYEMVTGQRLFQGEDLTDTLASVVKIDPNLGNAPPRLQRLLAKCLEKDPRKRLRDIGDWELLCEQAEQPDIEAPAPARASRLWPAIAALTTIALIAVAFLHFRETPPELQAVHFTLEPPPGTNFTNTYCGLAASPDGRSVVFTAAGEDGGPSSLWLQQLASGTATKLDGTEGGNCPTWSPDSRSLAFAAGGQLRSINITGGAPPFTLGKTTDDSIPPTGAWNRDDVILYGSASGLLRVPQSGGGATLLTEVDPERQETGHGYPQFLPDGNRFLYFVASTDPNVQGVYASSLSDPSQRSLVVQTAAKAVYVPPHAAYPGYLLWLQDQTLVARRFDPDTLEFAGNPVTIAEGVAVVAPRASFWASDAGLLIYFSGGTGGPKTMTWYDNEGQRLGPAGPEKDYRNIRLSPDASRAAVTIVDDGGHSDIWLYDFLSGEMTPLTFGAGINDNPTWSPDGSQIAFSSDREDGVSQIYRRDASGAGQAVLLTHGPNAKQVIDWSQGWLLYVEQDQGSGIQGGSLLALPLEGDSDPVPVTQAGSQEVVGAFSHDGKWDSYTSVESGHFRTYVQGFPSRDGLWRVPGQNANRPKWSRDDSELFYIEGSNSIMAVGIQEIGAGVRIGTPREVVSTGSDFNIIRSPYDVAPDGRLIVLESASEGDQYGLTVISNWQAGLQQ